ncbi:hypothetical protein LXL04_003156 [Taraxacum kok-saghyz]
MVILPCLYALESDKNVKVADRIGVDVDGWPTTRDIRDGRERSESCSIRDLLSGFNLSAEEDKGMIPSARYGSFSTQWLRKQLEEH